MDQQALERLRRLSTFLVDLDGVVYTGDTPIPGAAEFFRFLERSGRRFVCLTNNSTLTPEQYLAKLAGMDIPIRADQLLTSPQATAVYLREHFGAGARVYFIGENGLLRALLDAGFRLVEREAQVVVVGLDRRLTYERLTHACFAIRAGAPLVATNPDLALPTERGFMPGNGATIAYFEAATGVKATVIGKPESTMLHVAMEQAGAAPGETAIIGDNLLTDIPAGERAGVTTLLVLTGFSSRADLVHAPAQPHFVFENLPALGLALAGA
jgi:4-nitrophenyl phosphatase